MARGDRLVRSPGMRRGPLVWARGGREDGGPHGLTVTGIVSPWGAGGALSGVPRAGPDRAPAASAEWARSSFGY